MVDPAIVDLAYHVIAERGWTPPDTGRDALLLVHEYTHIDLEAIALVVQRGSADLRQLGAAIGALSNSD